MHTPFLSMRVRLAELFSAEWKLHQGIAAFSRPHSTNSTPSSPEIFRPGEGSGLHEKRTTSYLCSCCCMVNVEMEVTTYGLLHNTQLKLFLLKALFDQPLHLSQFHSVINFVIIPILSSFAYGDRLEYTELIGDILNGWVSFKVKVF